MTAQPASLAVSVAGGAVCLEWLRPAAEVAAPPTGCWRPGPARASWAPPPRVATRTAGFGPGAVKAVRDFTGTTLRRWGMADLDGDVGVIVSELLTNALHHALPRVAGRAGRAPIRVGLLQPGPYVVCAVADPSDRVPVVRKPDQFAETGRGLHVVASLSDRWGWTEPSRDGKVVWAMLAARWTGQPRG